MKKYYLAVDIGASSGRHILGWMENGSYYKDTLNSSTLFKYDEHKNILECVRIARKKKRLIV